MSKSDLTAADIERLQPREPKPLREHLETVEVFAELLKQGPTVAAEFDRDSDPGDEREESL